MTDFTIPEFLKEYRLFEEGTVRAHEVTGGSDLRDFLSGRFIAFDTETTGLSSHRDRIVELGATVFVNGIPADSFSSLVNAGVKMPAGATAVNHITDEMLGDAPTEAEIYPEFLEFLGDAVRGETCIVAHNACFDYRFLVRTLDRLGFSDIDMLFVDTLKLSRRMLCNLPNHRLGTLTSCLGLMEGEDPSQFHRASFDAAMCGKVLVKCWENCSFLEDVRHPERGRRR